jgi:hypothetical protein
MLTDHQGAIEPKFESTTLFHDLVEPGSSTFLQLPGSTKSWKISKKGTNNWKEKVVEDCGMTEELMCFFH